MRKSLVLGLIFLVACTAAPKELSNNSEQPNIVFILSDDQRADDLGSMPTLADLASQGTTFTKAYASTPLCCPSRSSILTGQYAHNHGVLGNREPYGFEAFEDEETIATWLQNAGYETALIGKYLNGFSTTKGSYIPPGWDTFMAFVKGPNYYDYTLTQLVNGEQSELLAYGTEPADYSTEVLTQHAITFLNAQEESDEKPFFLFFTPYAPHGPSTPPDHYENEIPTVDPSAAPSFNEADVSDKAEWVKTLPELTAQEEKKLNGYSRLTAGALKALDDGIAEILETLENNGELENTILIYMSDNGLQWGEHRIGMNKNTPFEESVRVPLIIYDGRQPQTQTVDEFALNIDLAPTLLEWAGLSPSESIDGTSLCPLLQDQSPSWRDSFLTEAWGSSEGVTFQSVHQGDWVYIDYGNGEMELYNLATDPYQLENLAENPQYATELAQLQEELDRLKDCEGSTCQ